VDLSIIIVSWNTQDLLQKCLRSIQRSGANLRLQTIVVDNNSSDGSREMVTRVFPEVRLMNSGGNLGFARANNRGLAYAEAPLVLFLNPDTEVTAHALETMVKALQGRPEVGALSCKLLDGDGRVQELGLQWFPSPATELLRFLFVSQRTYRRLPWVFPYHDPAVSGVVKKLYGACLMVRRSVLRQVGSFDERFFMYCEDVDLCRRIREAGWKLYYLSTVDVLHWGGGASANAPGRFSVLMMCESFSILMRKYYGAPGASVYRFVAFLGAQARLAAVVVLSALGRLRKSPAMALPAGTARRYVTIVKWTLGLERPVIRN